VSPDGSPASFVTLIHGSFWVAPGPRAEAAFAEAAAEAKSGWDQLVTTTWRESESGPPRRYYQLTESGHAALAAFVKDWARFRDSVDAILNGRKGDAHHGD
jgi:hypothetical protein